MRILCCQILRLSRSVVSEYEEPHSPSPYPLTILTNELVPRIKLATGGISKCTARFMDGSQMS